MTADLPETPSRVSSGTNMPSGAYTKKSLGLIVGGVIGYILGGIFLSLILLLIGSYVDRWRLKRSNPELARPSFDQIVFPALPARLFMNFLVMAFPMYAAFLLVVGGISGQAVVSVIELTRDIVDTWTAYVPAFRSMRDRGRGLNAETVSHYLAAAYVMLLLSVGAMTFLVFKEGAALRHRVLARYSLPAIKTTLAIAPVVAVFLAYELLSGGVFFTLLWKGVLELSAKDLIGLGALYSVLLCAFFAIVVAIRVLALPSDPSETS